MGFLGALLSFFSIGPTRSFGGVSGYITITENSVDALEITQHPVQQGAMISDHAFKKPVSISIQMQFEQNLGQNLSDTYASLLALQASLKPFNVVTPKRTYYNMLFAALGVTTDKKTENVLAINATFQEVIIVPVVTTVVPKSQLANFGQNAGTQNAGKKSALLSLAQGIGGLK
jgi:hypothetical protein